MNADELSKKIAETEKELERVTLRLEILNQLKEMKQ